MQFEGKNVQGDPIPWEIKPKPMSSSRSLTSLIPMKVSVYDIEDVEGFVNDMTLISQIRIGSQEERDEVVSEGIALLINMARNFILQKPGYDKPGKFSGYCAAFLPRKISNAWHKLHPEHLQEVITLDDGRKVKRYKYGTAPGSFDELYDNETRIGGLDGDRVRTCGDFVR